MNFLEAAELQELWDFMADTAAKNDAQAIAVGGMPDHAHLLLRLPPTVLLSDLVCKIKACSSGWIKKRFPQYKGFAWQEGYAAFTVGPTQVKSVERYIARQRMHHEAKTFEQEYHTILAKASPSP